MATLPPDDVLIQALRAGDRAVFESLVLAWTPGLRRLAQRLTGDGAVADEVVQDCWAGFLRTLVSFEGQSSLKTWTFRILFHQATTRARKERRTTPFSAFGDEEGDEIQAEHFAPDGHWAAPIQPWRALSPDDAAAQAQLRAALREEIGKLPERQRAVLELCDLDGVDAAEVCNFLGIRATNQRVLLFRARAALRQALERRFGGAS